MTLRFTNWAIKWLFNVHKIDLMKLDGDVITDPEKRVFITAAGLLHSIEGVLSDSDRGVKALNEAATKCDDITPGEHIQLLTEAIQRDLIPNSIREAKAKAADTSKSEPEAAA